MARAPLTYRSRSSLNQADLERLAQNEQMNHAAHKQWLAAKADGLKAQHEQAERQAGALKLFEREQEIFKRAEQQLVKSWTAKKVQQRHNSAALSQEADAQWRSQFLLSRGPREHSEAQRKLEQGFVVCAPEAKDRNSSSFLPPLIKHARYP